MNLIKPDKLIKRIGRSINRKKKLPKNLKRVIDLATIYDHEEVKDWAFSELNGYDEEEIVPHYRLVNITTRKVETFFIPERIYEKNDSITEDIEEVIKASKEFVVHRKKENFWGTPLIQSISQEDLLGIIQAVTDIVREYTSKVNLDPRDVTIDLGYEIGMDEDTQYAEAMLDEEIAEIEKGKFSLYIKNEREQEVFINNLTALVNFVVNEDVKFIMIEMGSLIEFLLDKHLQLQEVIPKRLSFHDMLSIAIRENIFGEQKSWEYIDSHLRDFRNYVHIQKEVANKDIDITWYESISPIFSKIYGKFEEFSEKSCAKDDLI